VAATFCATLAIRRSRCRESAPLPQFTEPDLETQKDFDCIASEVKSQGAMKTARKAPAKKSAPKKS